MKRKVNNVDFGKCNSGAFGFNNISSENSSRELKILNYFNRGLKSNYVRNEDCTDIENIKNSLL